jgi:hypothetical protein
MIRPSDVRLEEGGFLTDYLGKAEAEFAMAVVVRWHLANGHTEWTPVSRAELANFIGEDELVREWVRNPFWRPSPGLLVERGYITGWTRDDVYAPGTLTPKALEHLAERGAWERERGGR